MMKKLREKHNVGRPPKHFNPGLIIKNNKIVGNLAKLLMQNINCQIIYSNKFFFLNGQNQKTPVERIWS